MRGDMPEWATRLSSELPSRTHEARSHYGVETRGGDTSGKRKRGWNGGSNRKTVIVGNERFDSMRGAADAIGVHQKTMLRMLKDGRARYADA